MVEKRKAKAAARLREAILAETQAQIKPDMKLKGSADAVAVAGGMLWSEIVLNDTAYPRDRLKAWERLGRHAGILADKADNKQETAQNTVVHTLDPSVVALLEAIAGQQSASFDIIQITSTDNSGVVDGVLSSGDTESSDTDAALAAGADEAGRGTGEAWEGEGG